MECFVYFDVYVRVFTPDVVAVIGIPFVGIPRDGVLCAMLGLDYALPQARN